MDVVADLPADAQSAEPAQQCKGLFDEPPVDARPGAVFGASAGELWLDSLGADQIAVYRWDRLDQRDGWVTSCRLPPVMMTADGMSAPSAPCGVQPLPAGVVEAPLDLG